MDSIENGICWKITKKYEYLLKIKHINDGKVKRGVAVNCNGNLYILQFYLLKSPKCLLEEVY